MNHLEAVLKQKPYLRGRFHEASFFFGLGACAMLVAAAPSARSTWAAVVYTLCLAILFGVSSLYHRITWSDRPRQWLRKLDHAAIYIFIAGTATPICLLGLNSEDGPKLLLIFWASALVGILKELFWKNSPRWSSSLFYVVMGWLATPYLGKFIQVLGPQNTWLFVMGGVIYTVGALIYAFKWPNPSPKVFGYHEIFHIFVMVACLFHFLVIYDLVTA
jgi:hemolysin III